MASAWPTRGSSPIAWTFRLAARLAGVDRKLQAGEYRFADPATPYEVAARLARGDVYTHPITFPEGLTVAEMADLFGKSGLGTAAEFRAAARETALIGDLDPDAERSRATCFRHVRAGASRGRHRHVKRW